VRSVAADPVVVCWPGAYSDAPGAVEVLLFFILCPGAYSDAPGAVEVFAVEVLLFCILCPGEYSEEPGDFVLSLCANAAVVSNTVATVIIVFSISVSFGRWTKCNVPDAAWFQFFPDASCGPRCKADEQIFIYPRERSFCLTGKSVARCQIPLSILSPKNNPLNPSGKSFVKFRHPVPQRGALAIVTSVGAGCGGRGSVRRAKCSQGGVTVSELKRARRTALVAYGKTVWS
jgi:hypothetical protein